MFKIESLIYLVFGIGISPCYSQSAFDQLAADPTLRGAAVSFIAINTTNGSLIDSYLPDQRLCPASVWKLFSTSVALDLLGGDFKYRTTLVRTGPIEKGVLQGSLYVMGSGDPSFGSSVYEKGFQAIFKDWSLAVKAAGIDSIAGDIVVNAAIFPAEIAGTHTWEDIGNYFGSPAYGFNIADNTYTLKYDVSPKVGETAQLISVNPEVPELFIQTEVKSSTLSGDRAYIFGAPFTSERTVRGTLPAGSASFNLKGSLPDPALFGAYHLKKALQAEGIGSKGFKAEYLPHREPVAFQLIADYQSPSLGALVAETNLNSNNLFAEALLLNIGLQSGDASIEGSIEAMNNHLRTAISGMEEIYGYDGSGLSRYTAVSAKQVAQLLLYLDSQPVLKKGIKGTLPVAGKSGTLRSFGAATPLTGRFKAKSGSMDKVCAYAGYLTTSTGQELAVVIIINNHNSEKNKAVRKAIEQCLLTLFNSN